LLESAFCGAAVVADAALAVVVAPPEAAVVAAPPAVVAAPPAVVAAPEAAVVAAVPLPLLSPPHAATSKSADAQATSAARDFIFTPPWLVASTSSLPLASPVRRDSRRCYDLGPYTG